MENRHNTGHASWLVESLAEVNSSDEQEASQQTTDKVRLNKQRVERSLGDWHW